MDKSAKFPDLKTPFAEREPGVVPPPRTAGQMLHCMIINYQTIDTTISHERMAVKLAHPHLSDLEGGQFFRESGMSDEGFRQMVLREIYPYSRDGYVQNIKAGPPGCVSFDVDLNVYPQIRNLFPDRKFTLYPYKFAQDRNDGMALFQRFLQSRQDGEQPAYEHRPYLDA